MNSSLELDISGYESLQRSKVERRYPIIIACLSVLLRECTDESIEVFDLCLSESYRRSRNQYKEYRKKMDKLINAHNVVLQHIARLVINHNIPDEELRHIILHEVSEEKLREIIEDPKGIIRPLDGNHLDYFVRLYASYNYGTGEHHRDDRFFVDFDEDGFDELIKVHPELIVMRYWQTCDFRPGREEEKWLNILVRKTKAIE